MPLKPDKSLILIGKYVSLALTLPASAAGGYLLGALAGHWLRSSFLPVLGTILGMTGGLIQIFRELNRDARREK